MLRRHPVEVAEIVSKLRKGKSKHREADPAALTWTYQASVLIESSGSFEDLISGKMELDEDEWDALPLEEKVADQVRLTNTAIYASLGRWSIGSDVIPNPPEVETNARAGFIEEAAEQARADAMTPDEREQEIASLLGQLSGNRGFMAFGVK